MPEHHLQAVLKKQAPRSLVQAWPGLLHSKAMKAPDEIRILALADLHLGRSLYGYSLIPDQEYILEQIAQILEQEELDALCIAGDLFDRSVPSTEALRLADQFFMRLAGDLHIPTLVIAGNHDSPERLDFVASLLSRQGLYIQGAWNPKPQILELQSKDASTRLRLHPIPYAEPGLVRSKLGNPQVLDHQSAWDQFLASYEPIKNPSEGNFEVLVCHAYIAGGQESDSERPLSLGNSFLVQAASFAPFDLVIAGHLHRPQHIQPQIFYPGSPLVYSASECGQEKSLLLFSLSSQKDRSLPNTMQSLNNLGTIAFKKIPLKPQRELKRAQAYFEDLLEEGKKGSEKTKDFLYIDLLDKAPIYDAFARLQEYYPNVLHLERSAWANPEDLSRAERKKYVEQGTEALLEGFVSEMGFKEAWPAWKPVIEDLLRKVRQEPQEASPEERAEP